MQGAGQRAHKAIIRSLNEMQEEIVLLYISDR